MRRPGTGHFQCNTQAQRGLPDSALKSFKSSSVLRSEYVLFCCLFNPEASRSNLLAICDEEGYLSVLDVSKVLNPQNCWRAHKNALFDVSWVPGNPFHLLSASADNSAVLWDVEQKKRIEAFHGHNGSLRSISACPDNPNIFVTGGRDGAVMVFDSRNRTKDAAGGILPVNKIFDAHMDSSERMKKGKSPKPLKSIRGKKSIATSSACSADAKVTGVLFHSEDGVFSISDNCSSGVRYWDLRKTYSTQKSIPTPKRILSHPKIDGKRLGYAALCEDRFRSRLFVACTDHLIYEYDALPGKEASVVQSYEGARFESFYVSICCSPNEDYLLSGSSSGEGLIWDVSKSKRSYDGLRRPGKSNYLPYPRFQMNGHATEITGVSWSAAMDTIATCEDRYWRIWGLGNNSQLKNPREGGVAIEEIAASVGDFALPPSVCASKQLEHLIVSPVKRSPAIFISSQESSGNHSTPPGSPMEPSYISEVENRPPPRNQKRKLAFSSPFKSPHPHRSPCRSPLKKMTRIAKSRGFISDSSSGAEIRSNPFHYSTPTRNLPNFLLDREKHPAYKSPNRSKKAKQSLVQKPLGSSLTNFDKAHVPHQRLSSICAPVIKSPASKAVKITLKRKNKTDKVSACLIRRPSRKSLFDYNFRKS